MRNRDPLRVRLHRDGTISYWSVYEQGWCHHQRTMPTRELAALPEPERTRVRLFLKRYMDATYICP